MEKPILATMLLHPARVLRNGFAFDPAQLAFLERALDDHDALLSGCPPSISDPTVPPPGAILAPTMADLHAWARGPVREGITVDIECAGPHLVGVGFCRVADLVPIWIPFRRRGGVLYWPDDRLPTVVAWVDAILGDASVPKILHNCVFDVPYLLNLGFRFEGLAFDTMLAWHVAWPELSRGLQALATLHNGAPVWKQLSKPVSEEEAK